MDTQKEYFSNNNAAHQDVTMYDTDIDIDNDKHIGKDHIVKSEHGYRNTFYFAIIIALFFVVYLFGGVIELGFHVSTSREVDLGLSVNWAGYNLGATEPQDTGVVVERHKELNEYKELEEWKNGWRLPTKEECRELKEKCKWECVRYRGVTGWVAKGPNGKSIFFPTEMPHRDWHNRDGVYLLDSNEWMSFDYYGMNIEANDDSYRSSYIRWLLIRYVRGK